MATDLQELVDELAEGLGRPVLIDDPQLRPLAYSRQTGQLDEIRTRSILAREAPPRARVALLAHGLASARTIVHIPADPGLGMRARACVPLERQGVRLGYLWVIEDSPLDAAQTALLRHAAVQAREILAPAAHDEARRRERVLLERLMHGQAPEPQDFRTLEALIVRATGPVAVCVAEVRHGGAAAGEAPLIAGIDRLRRRMSSDRMIGAVIGGRAVCIAPAAAGGPASALQAAILHDGSADGAIAGAGHAFTAPGEAATSMRRATVALCVAAAEPDRSAAVCWEQLGASRIIALLAPDTALADLPGGLARLLDPEHTALRETLECYLDHAGDVQETAQALHLHRSGLYHRLRRIEMLAEVDLRRGEDRLLCHVALRCARLADGRGMRQVFGEVEASAPRRRRTASLR